MNKKREPYDKIAVGERIRRKRIQLGLSQDELAVRINRATKYCSDIERGMCGMSIETMLAIAKALDMNLDYMMFGEISETEREWQQKDALTLIHIIEKAPASQRNYAIRLLKLFLAAPILPLHRPVLLHDFRYRPEKYFHIQSQTPV